MLRSDNYVGLGCDLRNTARLTQYDDVRFCMLEQLLPQGQGHPFAQKMLQHFVNLGTPLRCVEKYPLLKDQETRFLRAGFNSVRSKTLWHLWQDQSVVAQDLRLHLNQVEPFDEWEEFALFSSHYFILEAQKCPTDLQSQGHSGPESSAMEDQSRSQEPRGIAVDDSVKSTVLSSQGRHHRKFGAPIPFSDQIIGMHGGIGDKGRLNTTTRYQDHGLPANDTKFSSPPVNVVARVCHTITPLDDCKFLLAGGRTSPDDALQDSWLYREGRWMAIDKLPIPLYRHCATAVAYGTVDTGVLIFGGRTTGGIVVNQWFLWRERTGWEEVCPSSGTLLPRFGATIASTTPGTGILIGGLTEAGVLSNERWEWTIQIGHDKDTDLQISHLEASRIAPRFGACLTWSPLGLLIIGGISTSLIVLKEEILRLSHEPLSNVNGSSVLAPTAISIDFDEQRPLLIGHSVCTSKDTLLIAGGGAVCFSFGSYWNMTTWTLNFPTVCKPEMPSRRFVAEVDVPPQYDSVRELEAEDAGSAPLEVQSKLMSEEVQRVRVETEADFDTLMHLGRPFVMEGLDLGSCIKNWTVPTLIRKIGTERLVIVHHAQGSHMNFQTKNFQYVKKSFGTFMKEVCDGSPQYLRSLNAERAAEEPACFADDFPGLSDQFSLPQQLATVARTQHSSPLRISGPVNMWLHYDVMANVLCQIVGRKLVALYPPIDAVHFKIPPGSSTSPLTVFHPEQRGSVTYPRHHIRAVLHEGDVLYIPPLWLHSTSPLDNLSVSINVFFRNLSAGYTAGKDVYGNRDLQAYENGRRNVERMVKSMGGLPKNVASTYLARLGEELLEKGKSFR
ncbi:MAG: hypothetical protein Q9169_001157 [Polycauliona sp. 2 TL-2023]